MITAIVAINAFDLANLNFIDVQYKCIAFCAPESFLNQRMPQKQLANFLEIFKSR